jgi:hypothetical protein
MCCRRRSLTEAESTGEKPFLAGTNYRELLILSVKPSSEDPVISEGWGGMGSCGLAMGKYYEARRLYERALTPGIEIAVP